VAGATTERVASGACGERIADQGAAMAAAGTPRDEAHGGLRPDHADIGARANIGAATIFANYDGAAKHRTTVGAHVFTGSDTVLVAPVTLGDGAYTAAGSVITEDVPPGALGIARGKQHNSEGWVERRRPGSPAAAAAARARKAGGPEAQEQAGAPEPDGGPAPDEGRAARGA